MEQSYLDLQRQQEHLKNVSRTFAFTIPFLPSDLVDYISNAYLLCRIADTIEDDPKAHPSSKISWLNCFAQFCHNDFSDEESLLTLHKHALSITKEGAKKEEYALLEDMILVIQRTRQYPLKVREILSRGVAILSFGMARSINGITISSLQDVDRYCYFVAGVVGELLAALFAYSNNKIDKYALLNLSVSFGEGLQLTNILKDRAEDAKRGVSFLPVADNSEDSITKQGNEYIEYAQGHLTDAIDFIQMIPASSYGIRMFCLLNVVMATATLKKIHKYDLAGIKHLKITRRQVKTLYVLCKLCACSNLLVRMLFRFVSFGVRAKRRSPKDLRSSVSFWDKTASLLTFERQEEE